MGRGEHQQLPVCIVHDTEYAFPRQPKKHRPGHFTFTFPQARSVAIKHFASERSCFLLETTQKKPEELKKKQRRRWVLYSVTKYLVVYSTVSTLTQEHVRASEISIFEVHSRCACRSSGINQVHLNSSGFLQYLLNSAHSTLQHVRNSISYKPVQVDDRVKRSIDARRKRHHNIHTSDRIHIFLCVNSRWSSRRESTVSRHSWTVLRVSFHVREERRRQVFRKAVKLNGGGRAGTKTDVELNVQATA